LPPGAVAQVKAGGREIALCHAADGVYAIDGVCPHRNGPLGQGALHGHAVVCPWHAWEFDCRTGQSDADSALRLATYRVVIENGEILVELP
jgi:nitrite reductase/ring-hydroxylating ferredoxin subunit